jgi:predicted dehydrogenase
MYGMLKMGIVGGGPGSMIGDIHRLTAKAKGKVNLVCGAFSANINKSVIKGEEIGLPKDRVYGSIEELIIKEKALPEQERMNFLAIATPNHLHVDAAILALESGFHVMCDKPLGISLAEAKKLESVVGKSKLVFGMTYTYRGYSAIQEVSRMIINGKIGKPRKIRIDYSQGWLSQLIENEGQKQAIWRTDPKYSGAGGTIADIGTHAFNLAEYLMGDKVSELCSQINTLVKGRQIDDDANVLMKFEKGAVGVLSVGQALTGEDNALSIHIHGEKGGLIWHHDDPKTIKIKLLNSEETVLVEDSNIDISEVINKLPKGHNESFLRGFADLYDKFIEHIYTDEYKGCPNIEDGVRGMLFIEKAIISNQKKTWVAL